MTSGIWGGQRFVLGGVSMQISAGFLLGGILVYAMEAFHFFIIVLRFICVCETLTSGTAIKAYFIAIRRLRCYLAMSLKSLPLLPV